MGSIYTVSQVNSYIKHLFTEDFALSDISIKGEVSNCKYHTSGHIYFTIKDGGSVISAVMFAGNRNGLSFALSEGKKIIARGNINVYERDGKYQLYAKEIIQDGQGDLYQKFEKLKKDLLEMGMFDPLYKKKIPVFGTKIGIVTASTGAAIQDIINISKRRNPFVQLYLYSAIVQGEGAAPSIVHGIEVLDEMDLDVIIVGRGGGSIEDLWGFNEESVARAIFSCNTPIISAVGHETDTTISDYVADLRAPTPSAAAEIAVFDIKDFYEDLENYKYSFNKLLKNKLIHKRNKLENYKIRIENKNPQNIIKDRRQYLDMLTDRLNSKIIKKHEHLKYTLTLMAERLNGMSPLLKIDKGFGYVSKEGKKINSIKNVSDGDSIDITLRDGKINAIVREIKENNI